MYQQLMMTQLTLGVRFFVTQFQSSDKLVGEKVHIRFESYCSIHFTEPDTTVEETPFLSPGGI